MTMVSGTSGYFDLDYYARIHDILKSWAEIDAIPEDSKPDAQTANACEALLYREARLIDRGRYQDWLNLFTDQAAYWLPADTSLLDPAATVSWEFNDRRRMEERVERILTGKAYSEIPPTKTTHSYTNIEQTCVADDEVHVLCSFMINAVRPDSKRLLSGWNGFILKRVNAEWMIELKRVNLVDANFPQGNLSFFL